MKVSFLKSSYNIRAVKTFTKNGVRAYPQIANFNSHDVDIPKTIEGLREKTALCLQAAEQGACMLKGYATEPLVNERRAGKVDKDALTENVIFDIDGVLLDNVVITHPINHTLLKELAEKIILQFPPCFHSVSYIVHASSSMGMKGNKICLHLDFALQEPTVPQALKEYVVYLNHNLELFKNSFALSASGTALRYPLDRTVIDNSHIIYLGNPEFKDDIVDPIPNPEDRIFLVEKSGITVNLAGEIRDHADATKNRRATEKKINEIRALHGLPERKEKTEHLTVNGKAVHVVINPESVVMAFAADNGNFVAYNVNGGDSGGYYVLKYRPSIVYNFKGEPNFLFEAADPETYQWHLATFIGTETASAPSEGQEVKARPQMPLVFRDEASNTYFNALLDTGTARISRIAKASRDGLADWMAQYEGVMPENVPIWNYEFNPHRPEIVSFRDRFINKFIPSEHMMPREMPRGFLPLSYDTAHMLHQDCPMIAELIQHVLGGNTLLFSHFLNWLATAFQTRDKLGTAWILQGVQGTGKGVLYEHIISPLVGTSPDQTQPYATKLRLENIEEQFNQWQECALFVALDEFRLSDSPRSQKLFNKIKSMITETHEPIRGMRENVRTVRTYSNWLFFSNDQDVMYLPEDDRRFNIGDRQEVKLRQIWGSEAYVINELIPRELPMFGVHMQHFLVDNLKARTVLETAGKIEMREVSRTTIEDFVHAFRHGDLEYFLPIMDMPYQSPGTGYVLPAQTQLKEFLRDFDQKKQRISVEALRILYIAFIGPSDNVNKFGKMMSRYGLHSERIRFGRTVKRGYIVEWNLRDNNIADLQERYLDPIDHQFGNNDKILAFPGALP